MTVRKLRRIRKLKSKVGFRPIKVDNATHRRLSDASNRLTGIQNRSVSMGEVIRRLSRIAKAKEILDRDAKLKRGGKK